MADWRDELTHWKSYGQGSPEKQDLESGLYVQPGDPRLGNYVLTEYVPPHLRPPVRGLGSLAELLAPSAMRENPSVSSALIDTASSIPFSKAIAAPAYGLTRGVSDLISRVPRGALGAGVVSYGALSPDDAEAGVKDKIAKAVSKLVPKAAEEAPSKGHWLTQLREVMPDGVSKSGAGEALVDAIKNKLSEPISRREALETGRDAAMAASVSNKLGGAAEKLLSTSSPLSAGDELISAIRGGLSALDRPLSEYRSSDIWNSLFDRMYDDSSDVSPLFQKYTKDGSVRPTKWIDKEGYVTERYETAVKAIVKQARGLDIDSHERSLVDEFASYLKKEYKKNPEMGSWDDFIGSDNWAILSDELNDARRSLVDFNGRNVRHAEGAARDFVSNDLKSNYLDVVSHIVNPGGKLSEGLEQNDETLVKLLNSPIYRDLVQEKLKATKARLDWAAANPNTHYMDLNYENKVLANLDSLSSRLGKFIHKAEPAAEGGERGKNYDPRKVEGVLRSLSINDEIPDVPPEAMRRAGALGPIDE